MLELLPTVTGHVLRALNSEQITQELQEKKVERLGRSAATSETTPSEISSVAPNEDGKSFSSESYVHTSQLRSSSLVSEEQRPLRTKGQLWSDLKISCRLLGSATMFYSQLIGISYYPRFHLALHRRAVEPSDACTTQPPRPKKLRFECRVSSLPFPPIIDDQSRKPRR